MSELEYKINPDVEEQLIKNPFKTICDWAENRVYLTGGKVFQFYALQPISLMSPDISTIGYPIRTNFHTLLIAPPGSGKSSLVRLLRDVTYSPFMFQDLTGARAIEELFGKNDVSLICGDVDTIFGDMELIKILEGILEEKRIDRFNMRRDRSFDTNAIFVGACIPNSLRRNIKFGFIQRMVPFVFFHTKEEQIRIGELITNKMFIDENHISFLDIKYYYKKIQEIQKEQNEKFSKIDGYIVNDNIKRTLQQRWKHIFELPFPEDSYFTRELQSPFRYICCSAMLNIFNREIVKSDGKRFIVPNDIDLSLAEKLFSIEMKMKFHIMVLDKMVNDAQGKDVLRLYERISGDTKLDYEFKQVGKIFIEQKLNKKIKE